MKRNVEYSTYSKIITVLVFAILLGCGVVEAKRGDMLFTVIFSVTFSGLILAALLYAPVSLTADSDSIRLRLPLHVKKMAYSDIESVKPCPPTMAEKRLLGSGGFFGYWGWFSEGDTGRYFAYYGKSSDCFLVTFKNGRKYMLGCADSGSMVDTINSRING